ncbi:unnamed protein product [Paramecium sonneborni]|uniref:Uncharacterized protein n=1 Tax=Paramecium sonneborni TaxID=65129 RepID=A0A8S1PUG2_9CILI|nr:unnamed protein product [Paramecium sonneborni]
MSQFYENQSSSQTQIRQKTALENIINQKNKPKSKQPSRNQILIKQSKPQTCIDISQNNISSPKQDQNIVKTSLLQDIGNIDLEIQKMTHEYQTPVNKTLIRNSNNEFNNIKVITHQLNKIDVTKSDQKILNSHDNQQTKPNQFSEISYSKLAESMKNYSNQKKVVEVKITDKPKIKPYNILSTKNQSELHIKQIKTNEINNSQNLMKPVKTKIDRLSSKINSERNKPSQIKPILKQTSFHAQKICSTQVNLNPNISNPVYNEIKNNINDDHNLDKAVKIYNTLKQLVNQNSIFQHKVNKQKEHKNQMHL